MRFSPSTGACYHPALDYPNAPDDLVDFSDNLHAKWCNTPGSSLAVKGGKVVLVMDGGETPKVEEVDPTAPSSDT